MSIARAMDVLYTIVVATIERVSQPQNCRQLEDRFLIGFVQHREVFMSFLWRRPAMITRGVRNHVALSFRKSRQLGILDQIERMLVMIFVGDVITDVMQQRGRRKQG